MYCVSTLCHADSEHRGFYEFVAYIIGSESDRTVSVCNEGKTLSVNKNIVTLTPTRLEITGMISIVTVTPTKHCFDLTLY
jgi:hypothetical protein